VGGPFWGLPFSRSGYLQKSPIVKVVAIADSYGELVSSTVKDLVVGSGIDLIERCEHELKGVPGIWRLILTPLLNRCAQQGAPQHASTVPVPEITLAGRRDVS
jgi:hypothetical protein